MDGDFMITQDDKKYPIRPYREPYVRVEKGMRHCVIDYCTCGHLTTDHAWGIWVMFWTGDILTHCEKCMCPQYKKSGKKYEFDIMDYDLKEIKQHWWEFWKIENKGK